MPDEVLYCIPIQMNDGTVVYVPEREYRSNPPRDSFELRERQRYPEPAPWSGTILIV